MRSRVFVFAAIAAAVSVAEPIAAQGRDPMAGGITEGDYLRISGGVTKPVNAQGSLKDWGSGTGFSIGYENWGLGGNGNGVGNLGFGLAVAYNFLPLDEAAFSKDFVPLTGGTTTGGTASRAGILEVMSLLRFRIPAPLVMPTLNVGFGFINWAPSKVHYTSTTGNGDARYAHRNGAEFSFGASVQRQIYDRYGLFVDAAYVFGYTAYGRFAGAGGTLCTGCDPLKNTTIGTLRGGLSVRVN